MKQPMEDIGTRQTRGKMFYGWWIVIGGFLVQLFSSLLFFHSFGAYFVYLQAEFGWSRTMISGASSIARLESGILGPVQGWLVDRFGPRALVRVGSIILGCGLILFSQINSVWQYYGAFLLMALGSSFAGFMAVSACLASWFVRKRTRAMGIAMTGMGVGGLLVPMVAWFLGHYGWRQTALVSGLIVMLVGLGAAQLLRRTPEQYGMVPDGEASESDVGESTARGSSRQQGDGEVSFTAREALRTKSFWLLSTAHAGGLLVVSAIGLHLIPHVVNRLGVSVEIAGTMVSLLMGMTIVGQIAGGSLGDRIDKRLGLSLCLLGHAVALTVLAFATSMWMVAIFAIIQGLSFGSRGPLVMSIRADYFGRSSYATIMGFSSLIIMLGSTGGPLLAGNIADRYGDYQMAFIILALVAVVSAVMFLFVRKPRLPARLSVASENTQSR
jgi:sugar phosphate permease